MAKRAWVVRPDSEVTGIGPDGEDTLIPAVSLNALASATLEGITMVHRAGGVLSVLVSRTATGLPDERVTSAAMIEWKDRTDARPQPESAGPELTAASNGHREPVAVAVEPADADESSVPQEHRES